MKNQRGYIHNLSVTVVTVTYGRRWCFLSEVLRALLPNEHIATIIVVDNGSEENIAALTRGLGSNKVHVISMGHNRGSAAGFKRGIEEACARGKGELIWLLDDDNKPEPECLARLLAYYQALGNDPNNCFLALRERQRDQVELINMGYSADPRPNSFLGFHWRDIVRKIVKRMRRKQANGLAGIKFALAKVAYAPYGGFLFHRSWVNKVGLPDESFFLYGDDHEYTWRFTQQGASIWLCANCRIIDIDISWHHQKHDANPFLSPKASAMRMFYASRNRAYFEKAYLTTNILAYAFNIVLYISFMLVKSMVRERERRGVLKRLVLFIKALRLGWKRQLGIVDEKEYNS